MLSRFSKLHCHQMLRRLLKNYSTNDHHSEGITHMNKRDRDNHEKLNITSNLSLYIHCYIERGTIL